ncbi:hypothetical protein Tco_0121229 [Tanacetum coccineum]
MGEPLSPDRVFDFPVDEAEPHPAYNFFAPGPLPGYAGNPNNNNGWIEADVVDVIAEPIVEAEEQMIAPVVDIDEDIAMLFGDDDFEDDASDGFDGEELVKKVIQVMASQMVRAADRWEQIGAQVQALHAAVQQRDTLVTKMSSRESTLTQFILGMDRRLADL